MRVKVTNEANSTVRELTGDHLLITDEGLHVDVTPGEGGLLTMTVVDGEVINLSSLHPQHVDSVRQLSRFVRILQDIANSEEATIEQRTMATNMILIAGQFATRAASEETDNAGN